HGRAHHEEDPRAGGRGRAARARRVRPRPALRLPAPRGEGDRRAETHAARDLPAQARPRRGEARGPVKRPRDAGVGIWGGRSKPEPAVDVKRGGAVMKRTIAVSLVVAGILGACGGTDTGSPGDGGEGGGLDASTDAGGDAPGHVGAEGGGHEAGQPDT